MKTLSKYMNDKFRDHDIFIYDKMSIGNQGNELYEYFDGEIPKHLEEMFVSDHSLKEVMLEHLRNIDSKYILKDLKEWFDWCYDLYEDEEYELIYVKCKQNPRKNEDFQKLLDIYQYNIKTCYYKRLENIYEVILDKNFPIDVTERVNKSKKNRYLFHVTSRKAANIILEKGLRPGYHYDDPKNLNKQVWKQYKESHGKEKWNKTYLFYIQQFYMDNESLVKIKKIASKVRDTIFKVDNPVLLCVHLPEETRVYTDKSMPMRDCCFTYAKIPPQHIYEIKNGFQ